MSEDDKKAATIAPSPKLEPPLKPAASPITQPPDQARSKPKRRQWWRHPPTVLAALAAVASLASVTATFWYVRLTAQLVRQAMEPYLVVESARLEEDDPVNKQARITLQIINRGNGPAVNANIKTSWTVGAKPIQPAGALPTNQFIASSQVLRRVITLYPDEYVAAMSGAGVDVEVTLDATYSSLGDDSLRMRHWKGVYNKARGPELAVVEQW